MHTHTHTFIVVIISHSLVAQLVKNPPAMWKPWVRSLEEGKSYPLQYSGLENSIWCIVHGVAKSWTWLSDFHFTSLHIHASNHHTVSLKLKYAKSQYYLNKAGKNFKHFLKTVGFKIYSLSTPFPFQHVHTFLSVNFKQGPDIISSRAN